MTMWATTVTYAAKALGILPDRLSNWVRLGKFQLVDVQYPFWDPSKAQLQRRRLYPEPWIAAVGKEIGVTPDWESVPRPRRIDFDG